MRVWAHGWFHVKRRTGFPTALLRKDEYGHNTAPYFVPDDVYSRCWKDVVLPCGSLLCARDATAPCRRPSPGASRRQYG
ncbi:hypothetical protein ARTHRO9V_280307 [Arthrobacter sp. 9V]|nr:hypothetical protein ARTHRO9V_280307 [Arthrobacter sp. 9V]